jgi:hypothetical protein
MTAPILDILARLFCLALIAMAWYVIKEELF